MLRSRQWGAEAAVAAYLREALGVEARLTPCAGRSLPAHLTHTYTFACGTILDATCVFAIAPADVEPAPAAIEKHLTRIGNAFEKPAVLVARSLSARERTRLVERGVPFIVPFAHLYLPPLGIDFREKARPRGGAADARAAPDVFTPTTQLVLLYVLSHAPSDTLDARDLAEDLRVSTMSISRALRNLEAVGLVERWQEGRKRPGRLARARREVWQEAQPYLASPVKARYPTFQRWIPGALESGVTALARVSTLAPPREPTVALSAEAWRELREAEHGELVTTETAEANQMILEVWTYAPTLLSAGPSVDILSLYLSLLDEYDERIQIALESALESQWT